MLAVLNSTLGSEIVRWFNVHACNLGCMLLTVLSLATVAIPPASFCCRIKFYAVPSSMALVPVVQLIQLQAMTT